MLMFFPLLLRGRVLMSLFCDFLTEPIGPVVCISYLEGPLGTVDPSPLARKSSRGNGLCRHRFHWTWDLKLDDHRYAPTLLVRQDSPAGTSYAAKSVRSSAFFDCGQIDDELMSAVGAYSLDQVGNPDVLFFSGAADCGVCGL